jgi:hypothetical protein
MPFQEMADFSADGGYIGSQTRFLTGRDLDSRISLRKRASTLARSRLFSPTRQPRDSVLQNPWRGS